ncbi:MAG: hypothetical protein ACJAYE_000274 [Candidatus Azotimanducaceae bacterium]|jgi:hypothetical protein
MEIGAGLSALAFWGFIGTCVIAGVWSNIRKRETKHETLRRIIESGQTLDDKLLKSLGLIETKDNDRPDRAFKIAALWLLAVSVGLAILSIFLGNIEQDARTAVLGVSALAACTGIGAWIGGMITTPWYEDQKDR